VEHNQSDGKNNSAYAFVVGVNDPTLLLFCVDWKMEIDWNGMSDGVHRWICPHIYSSNLAQTISGMGMSLDVNSQHCTHSIVSVYISPMPRYPFPFRSSAHSTVCCTVPMSANNAVDADNGNNASMTGGVMSALGCANCWSSDTGLIARIIIIEGLISAILGLVGLGMFTMMCPSLIFNSYGIGIYRFFTSILIATNVLSGLFAVLYMWLMARTIESNRGSIWFAFTILEFTFLTNAILILLSAIFGLGAGSDFFLSSSFCVSGLWPAAMGVMVLECMEHPEEERAFCCIPGIKMKYHPFIMLLFMFFLSLPNIKMGWIIGTVLGYTMHYYPSLELSATTATRWELSDKMRWLTSREAFRFSQVQGLGGGHWSAPSHPPARFATVHGANNNSNVIGAAGASSSNAQQPHVFSGVGHRLGSASPSSLHQGAVVNVAPSAPTTQNGMGHMSSGSTRPSSNDVNASTAQAEARRQRAAAIDKRLGKTSVTSPQSAPIVTSDRINSMNDRPPSPSGIRSALSIGPPASAGVFTLGLDEGENSEYMNELDVERGDASTIRSCSIPSTIEPQGYEMSNKPYKGKKGYAAVNAVADGPEDDDEDGESSALHSSATNLHSVMTRSSPSHSTNQPHPSSSSAEPPADEDDPLMNASELTKMQVER
jgi:hypothetical protein